MPKFAARGDVYLRDIADRTKKIKQIFWGDWLNVSKRQRTVGQRSNGGGSFIGSRRVIARTSAR